MRTDSMFGVTKISNTRNTSGISCARSYRTLRDGSLAGRFPRHFVPGYDRCCPYGTRCAGNFAIIGNYRLKGVSQPLQHGALKAWLPNVPEGRCDRSLARSAWDSATPKEPSRRVRSDSCRYAHRFDDWSDDRCCPYRTRWQTFRNSL